MPTRALLAACVAASLAVATPPPLPERGKADPPTLLESGEVLPPILAAPASLEEISAAAPVRRGSRAPTQQTTVQNAALQSAAIELRKKAALFRAGRCTKAELRAAAAEVNRAAAIYRASLARR